ncbi:MAG: hypothetical protein M3Z01_00770 [Thermoproteota archaeon]|nr:hypothetical protein [Thermoproteota archaeon]
MYEEFIIFILVVQTTLFSLFLIILFKRLQKIINDNNDLRKNIYDKVDEITLSINNFSTFILKIDMFSVNSSIQKSLSDIHLLLKKDDSAPWGFNNEKIKIGNSNKHNVDHESISDFKSPASPDTASTSAPFTSVQVEPKIDKSIDLKNELEEVENRTDFSNDQNCENNSVDELKTLENEILIALKRLEKTNSYVDEQKEKQGNE